MAVYTTIDNPELYFQVKLYAGDGNSTQAITLDGDEDMQPNLVWLKNRTDDVWHVMTDSVQGAGAANGLSSNSSEGAGGGNKASYGFLSAFGSDGFTVSEGSSNASMSNQSSKNYVAWCWKESADAGFDIVTFTGSGGTQNISHSLSAKPELILNKSRSASGNWYVYHGANTSAPETDFLQLQATDATSDNATLWNDTAPTTSVFTVGSAFDNTTTYVAYAFASKQGFSKFGSYTGNGNADGTFVYTGFRPAFIMTKCSSASSTNWSMMDNKRFGYNVTLPYVYANSSGAELTDQNVNNIDILSNGFKCRESDSNRNGSGNTYIYMAFAEAPFVNSKGVPCNAR